MLRAKHAYQIRTGLIFARIMWPYLKHALDIEAEGKEIEATIYWMGVRDRYEKRELLSELSYKAYRSRMVKLELEYRTKHGIKY